MHCSVASVQGGKRALISPLMRLAVLERFSLLGHEDRLTEAVSATEHMVRRWKKRGPPRSAAVQLPLGPMAKLGARHESSWESVRVAFVTTAMDVFAFAGFSLDARQRLLFGVDGKPIALSGRAFDTLLYLVEHPDELIDKQQLMNAVWPNTVVEDNNLNQNISIVRRALGEAPGEHRFIVTVPGRGFRFVSRVQHAEAADPKAFPPTVAPQQVAPAVAASQPRSTTRRVWLWGIVAAVVVAAAVVLWARLPPPAPEPTASVAVVPFANLTGDASKEYFSDGVAEELINELTRVPGLKVPARTSSFAYKGRNVDVRTIAHDLGVTMILEGSVRSAGERIRVTAQLVNAQSGFHVWSQSYDRDFGDVFKLEDDISAEIVAALKHSMHVELPAAVNHPQPTQDTEAYRLYLQAEGAADPDTALRLYADAIARDPRFARAYAGSAGHHILLVAFGAVVPGALASAEREAKWAIELDPSDAEAYGGLGGVYAARGNWLAAETNFQTAMQLVPNEPITHASYGILVLATTGHMSASLEQMIKAYELNPARPSEISQLAATYSLMGLDAQAQKYTDLAKEMGPRGPPATNLISLIDTTMALRRGEYAAAADLALAYPQSPWRTPAARAIIRQVFAAFGQAEARSAAAAAFRTLAREMQESQSGVSRYDPMLYSVLLGDLDFAFEAANRAIDVDAREGSIGMAWGFLWMPEMRPFRQDPRFTALATRLKLVDYWKQHGPPDLCDLVQEKVVCR